MEKNYNEKELKKSINRSELLRLKRLKSNQEDCTHLQGGWNGSTPGTTGTDGAFVGHKLPTGECIGIFLYCQKVISSVDPDDYKFLHLLQPDRSEATQSLAARSFEDRLFAQLDRFTPENRERILKKTIKAYRDTIPEGTIIQYQETEKVPIVKAKLTTAEMYDMAEEKLKVLAQAEWDKMKKR